MVKNAAAAPGAAIIKQCEFVAGLFASLSHPVRLKVLCCLLTGEKSVSDLTEFCGISQPTMSQFLSRMKEGMLVDSRRDGNRIFYSIADDKLARLLGAVKDLYC